MEDFNINELIPFRETPYNLQFLFGGLLFRTVAAIDVLAGVTRNFRVTKTTARHIHLISRYFQVNGVGMALNFYEGSTFNAGGTTGISRTNCNRTSTKTSIVTIVTDAVINTTGTLLESVTLIPSLKWNQQSHELILKNGTDYLFTLTNSSGVGLRVTMNWIWYEASN
jgi:hypothetical protein